jgi:hypothetical protein
MIRSVLFIIISVFISKTAVLGQQNTSLVKVKYLSANHVYLDGGSAQGIAVNDTIKVVRGAADIALLKVIFVADNSANCEVISKQAEITVGDGAIAYIHQVNDDGAGKDVPVTTRKRDFKSAAKYEKKRSSTRISGYVSTQWYQFFDANNGRYNFSQPTLRFNFNGRNLWDDAYNIRIRARSRYNDRSRRYSADVPQTEWRNRIYEFSFSYDNLSSMINYKFGRIISNKFSGVGYIDGVQLQHNISEKFNWGIFAGTQPEWQYSDFQISYQKYGAYASYSSGDYKTSRFESTLAFAGTYHNSDISREVLFWQNNYNRNRKWSIYQSLEVDLNRDWRKKAAGENFSLSGLYINGRYYINDDLNLGLSYDNRKNYYTYELRSLADSLFDDAFRQGARISVNYRLFKNLRLFGNSGVRKRDTSELTYSYSGGFNASNIFNQRISLSGRFSGFSNLYTEGLNPTVSLSKYFSAGHFLQIGYGQYSYTLKSNNSSRLNQYVDATGQLELPLNLFLSADYEYSYGDDSEGHRILAELGYRF